MSRPFDEARYRALLEGLEAAEILSSGLERTGRFDAEFFDPKHLRVASILSSHKTQSLTELVEVSDGNHFSISEEFAEDGIPYYRGQDVVGHFFIEQARPNFITEAAFRRPFMVRSHLKRGDVLLTIVGTIGEVSLVAETSAATCSCKLAILRPRYIAAEYLAVFLRSEFGRSQIQRLTRGAVQMGLLLEDMDQLKVARCNPEFEAAIVSTVASAKRSLDATMEATEQAERIMLQTLGLEHWQPPEPLTYNYSVREVFDAGRMDAAYFHPRYDAAFANLAKRFQMVTLGQLGGVSKGVTVPYYEDAVIPIIRSGDLSDIDSDHNLLRTNPGEGVYYLEPGDILISSIGFGSIGKIQVFDKPGCYGTVSEVTVVRQKKINPYCLAGFLRSTIGQMQIERYITGATGQLHLYPANVEKIFVPILPVEEQLMFELLAKDGKAKRIYAGCLLDAAKRAVEIAIESDEATAMDFLNRTVEIG